MVHELVVLAMVGAPVEGRIFESAGTEDQRAKLDRQLGLEGKVRKQAVIPESDAKAGGDIEEEEQADLEPVQAEMPNIKRNGDDREDVDNRQKQAGGPIDTIPRDSL